MSQNLDDALKAIQDIVGKVEGVRAAPEYATDKVPPGTWSMVFPVSGEYTEKPTGTMKGLHAIGLYVYTPRIDLAKTLAKIIPLGDKVAGAILDEPTLYDTASSVGAINYEFNMALNVGTISAPAYVAGWSFVIYDVKIDNTEILA
jgi:hypothetical protein